MKKILLILIVTNFLFSVLLYSQKNNNIPNELVRIFETLDRFEISKNPSLINDDFSIRLGTPDNFSRKTESTKWEDDLIRRISLSLRLINRIENYPNFNFVNKYQHRVTPPSCYDTTRIKEPFINGVRLRTTSYPKNDLSDFGDENCKKEYQRLLKENEQYKLEYDYQITVNQLLFKAITEIVDYFEHSQYTTIKDIDSFVKPMLESHLDSEIKIQEFNKRFEIAVNISKEQAVLNQKH